MSFLKVSGIVALLSALAQCHPTKSEHSEFLVHTNSFAVQGVAWPNTTGVSFWGGIPYAEPPIDELRFRPPVTKRPTNQTVDGSWFGPSCIQYSNGQKTVYSEYLKGFLLSPGQKQSEDCLTLNIWAPSREQKDEALPVMIWIHGGGFTSGGSASPYKYGDRLAKDQNVVVVALKWVHRQYARNLLTRAVATASISLATQMPPHLTEDSSIRACLISARQSNGSMATSPRSEGTQIV